MGFVQLVVVATSPGMKLAVWRLVLFWPVSKQGTGQENVFQHEAPGWLRVLSSTGTLGLAAPVSQGRGDRAFRREGGFCIERCPPPPE